MLLSLLRKKLKAYSADYKMKLLDTSFLLSLSGGMDSIIMASLLLEIRNECNFKLGFAHMNHNAHILSNKVERFCSKYSNDNDVLYFSNELSFDSRQNFEACAREKRYTILNEIAEQHLFHFILTAHHQDDQLETVFMKKMDGADWISRIGIRERMGKLRRPFLGISKNEIQIYSKQHNIHWIEDPTNSDIRIRRNKVRYLQLQQAFQADSDLKESLLKTTKKYVLKLKKTSLKLQKDENKVIKNRSKNKVQIERKALQNYNTEELKLFIYTSIAFHLRIHLNQQSGGLWREFKDFIKQSCTGAIFHIDILTFIINRNEIVVVNNYEQLKTHEQMRLCHNLFWYTGQFKTRKQKTLKISSKKDIFTVPKSIYHEGLYIRPWKHGDRIVSATSHKHVSLSDLYINNKLSIYEKLTQPVLVDYDDRIIWIPGLLHGKIDFQKKEKVKDIYWVQV